jgi:hypothetical protein
MVIIIAVLLYKIYIKSNPLSVRLSYALYPLDNNVTAMDVEMVKSPNPQEKISAIIALGRIQDMCKK